MLVPPGPVIAYRRPTDQNPGPPGLLLAGDVGHQTVGDADPAVHEIPLGFVGPAGAAQIAAGQVDHGFGRRVAVEFVGRLNDPDPGAEVGPGLVAVAA